MRFFPRKIYRCFWRIIIVLLKIMTQIGFIQRILILKKVLEIKYFKIRQEISLNNYYVVFLNLTNDNVEKLNSTLKSLYQIEINKLLILLIDEKDFFKKYFNIGKKKYADCVSVHTSVSTAVLKLGKFIDENDGDVFFAWVNPGDLFSPLAFEKFDSAMENNQKPEIIYSDWVLEDSKLRKYSALLFPDFSFELLYSFNYLSNSFVLLNKKNWDRYAESIVTYGEEYIYGVIHSLQKDIIHIPEILCIRQEQYPHIPSEKALIAINECIQVVEKKGNYNQIVFNHNPKKFSIIIPSRDDLQLLEKCIRSILDYSTNEDFEIILVFDKNGKKRSVKNSSILKFEKIKYIYPDQDFNYSAFNNIGAEAAIGQYLIFLNDDIEVLNGRWLNEISQWLDQPGIGIVGGCLYYSDLSIQHAGIVVGLIGHGGNIFRGEREYKKNYPFGNIKWYRNYLAVTGACLAIRKELFNKTGQFDENYKLVYSDVALCVEVNKAGYRILYNPFVEMIHHEGKTRKRKVVLEDCLLFEKQYKDILLNGDKFFNPNLSYLSFIPKLRVFSEMSPLDRLNKLRSLNEK